MAVGSPLAAARVGCPGKVIGIANNAFANHHVRLLYTFEENEPARPAQNDVRDKLAAARSPKLKSATIYSRLYENGHFLRCPFGRRRKSY